MGTLGDGRYLGVGTKGVVVKNFHNDRNILVRNNRVVKGILDRVNDHRDRGFHGAAVSVRYYVAYGVRAVVVLARGIGYCTVRVDDHGTEKGRGRDH